MLNGKRVDAIVGSMNSFSKEKYQKEELINELLALQKEMVNLTFNGEHASLADLKIWDVEKHFENLNKEYGNIADNELIKFKEESRNFCNLIKAEIHGARGEAQAFRYLQRINCPHIILRNVELEKGDIHTEIDAVVVTPSAITIVEVKNTNKDIFIDVEGNYYRTGKYLRKDCNIAEKMLLRRQLLQDIIGEEIARVVPIKLVVVFSRDDIEVQNNYREITTCFASQLVTCIEKSNDEITLSEEQLKTIGKRIKEAECKGSFPLEFDINGYKRDFAVLMTCLEEAAASAENVETTEQHSSTGEEYESCDRRAVVSEIFNKEAVKRISVVAAVVVSGFIAPIAIRSLIKKVESV